jgi:hypothetical protein
VRRQIGIFGCIAQFSLFAAIQVIAQEAPVPPNPSIPDDVLRSQLIAWSQAAEAGTCQAVSFARTARPTMQTNDRALHSRFYRLHQH